MYTFLRHVSAVTHKFPLRDHKSQLRCNWTWSAAAKLSLSLITNFSGVQLKLSNEQRWCYYPRQRTLLVLQTHDWKAHRVSCLPQMQNKSINTRNSENTTSARSLMMLKHLFQHRSPSYCAHFLCDQTRHLLPTPCVSSADLLSKYIVYVSDWHMCMCKVQTYQYFYAVEDLKLSDVAAAIYWTKKKHSHTVSQSGP